MKLLIDDDGVRPAGSPDKCFYCGRAKGAPHKADCVIPQRSVVLEMKIKYVASVPAYWTEGDILFHRNESSTCSNNDIQLIARQAEADGPNICNSCSRTEVSFVREATELDMEEMGFNAERGRGA